MTRKEAISLGLERYFTGRPCPHGHIAMRRVSGACVECANSAKRKWNEEQLAKNPEKVKASKARSQKKHRGAANARTRKYSAANREVLKVRVALWAKNNSAYVAAKATAYRAKKLKATPSWADPVKIASFYESAHGLSMLLGEWHHVDHIVPLQGKNVCGLHVQNNLQILTARANQSKSNHF